MVKTLRAGRRPHPRRGATVVEFVVIVGLIVVAASLTCSVLGDRVRSSFSRLEHAVPVQSETAASLPEPSAESSARLAFDGSGPALAERTDQGDLDRRLANQRWLAGATCLAAASALFLGRRRSRRPQSEPHSLPRAEELIDKRQKLLLVLQNHLQQAGKTELSVRQLMSSRLVAVRSNATIDKVRHFMRAEHVRHVLVCQGASRLVGVISDRDLFQRSGATADAIMTANPISVRPDTALIAAATTMLNRGISCLPVVENERLCGVLTTTDLVLGLQATLQLLEKLACQPDWSGAAAG